MAGKMLGMFTAVAVALLLVGVAWAGTDGAAEDLSSTEATVATIPDEAVTTPTPTGEDDDDDTTSTSIHDDDDDTTSTSIHDDDDDTTSTSIHEDDDENHEVFEDQRVVHDIPGVGSVTVEIVDGRLELVNVLAPGWDIEVEHAEADRVEVKLRSGSHEVEFEAEMEHGKIKIEIEIESS